MTVFGAIVTPNHVEAAAERTVRKWLPTYLAEMERQLERAPHYFAPICSWSTSASFDKWPEDQLPMVLITSPGSPRDSATKQGDGALGLTFDLSIGVIVSARDEKSTKNLADAYAGAILALVVQQPSLNGFASGLSFRGYRDDTMTFDSSRTMAAAVCDFRVEVSSVVNTRGGIREPLEDPYDEPPPWPLVESTDVEVDRT